MCICINYRYSMTINLINELVKMHPTKIVLPLHVRIEGGLIKMFVLIKDINLSSLKRNNYINKILYYISLSDRKCL